jgi:YbbR domain-containing protein
VKVLLHTVREDWRLKSFSLAMGLLLFLFVNVESSTSVSVDYAIVYRTAEDIIITSEQAPKIVATLKGPWAGLRSYADMPEVIIDLREAEPGNLRQLFNIQEFSVPTGMKIVDIVPTHVDITLDRLVEKAVPIEVDTLGRPAFGFEIAEISSDPPRVRIEGPLTKIRLIDFVYTRPVDLKDREKDINLEAQLRPPSPPVRLIERTKVNIFINISEENVQRDFEAPVTLEPSLKRARFTPQRVSFTLEGPRRIVDKIAQNAFVASVDPTRDPGEKGRLIERYINLKPELSEKVQLISSIPKISITLPRRTRRSP